ncbi:MAG: protein-glutamate O-methyltransferase [Syntrophaceae bacterium]
MNFDLGNNEFEKISRLVYDVCGIDLHEGKRELVKTRLIKRLREGNFRSFSDYCKFVSTREGTDELVAMIDSISTNLTSFFREDKHFEKMRLIIAQRLQAMDGRRGRLKLRVWSAGCSTGEEPYTISMVLKEIAFSHPVDFSLWATDISTRVLKTAVAGIYPQERIQKIPPELVRKYFLKGKGSWEGYYRVKAELKQHIEFARFNLKESLPGRERFDMIFCRNVMIYFDKDMQRELVGRFYNCLAEGGYFFVGHSESLTGLNHQYKYIEPSVYRK